MQAVNLLPADAVQKHRRQSRTGSLSVRKTLRTGGALTGLLAVLMVGLFFYERSVVADKNSKLADDQAQLVTLQARAEPIRQRQADAAARLAVVERVTEARMDWDRTMGDLGRVLPADAYLTSLQASAPAAASATSATTSTSTSTDATSSSSSSSSSSTTTTAPAVPTSTSLTMAGVTPSHVRVAALLDRLALLPWLTNVTLQSSTRSPDGTTSFTLTGLVSEVH